MDPQALMNMFTNFLNNIQNTLDKIKRGQPLGIYDTTMAISLGYKNMFESLHNAYNSHDLRTTDPTVFVLRLCVIHGKIVQRHDTFVTSMSKSAVHSSDCKLNPDGSVCVQYYPDSRVRAFDLYIAPGVARKALEISKSIHTLPRNITRGH